MKAWKDSCLWAIFSSYERNVAEMALGLMWTALSLIQFWFKNSLMISRMPPKARLWLNCNEKSKDNWNFKPTRPLFLSQRWQPAGSSSTVFAFYFFVTLSNWGEWSKDKISFNRKKLSARLTMHGKGLIYLGTIFRVTKLAFLERKYYN